MHQVQRHDLLIPTQDGRARICEQIRSSAGAPGTLMADMFGLNNIPLIVRRRSTSDQGLIGVGISFPVFQGGQRLRFATALAGSEILDVLSPYTIVDKVMAPSLRPIIALQVIMRLGLVGQGNLGIYGASALQVITGLDYVHDRSDLDLIIRGETIETLRYADGVLSKMALKFNLGIDVEVVLFSGGGVKLKELCSQQRTVIVKSILSVDIMDRSKAIQSLCVASREGAAA